MKIPAAKAAVDKEWEKLEKIPAWDLTKVRSKSEVIDEARTSGAKVLFHSLIVHRGKGLFLSVHVDDIKLAGKKQNLDPMWKVLNKEVDLGEPTSFLDHVYLGCTQRQCETSKDVVDNFKTMFESRISAGATEKQPCSEKSSCFFVVV